MSIKNFFKVERWKRRAVAFLIGVEIGLKALILSLEKIEELKNKRLAKREEEEDG